MVGVERCIMNSMALIPRRLACLTRSTCLLPATSTLSAAIHAHHNVKSNNHVTMGIAGYSSKANILSQNIVRDHKCRILNEHTSQTQPLAHNQHLKYIHTSSSRRVFENTESKELTIWSNVRQLKASPVPALALGLSGLLPFIGAPAYIIYSGAFMADVAFAQYVYGATILSFLGGVRWGFTLPEENPIHPDWVNLGYGILPPLVAWVGLLLPDPVNVLTLIGGMTFAAYCDMAMYGYPPWFKGLRFLLSFFAVLSLWTTFMCKYLLRDSKDKVAAVEEKKE